MLNITEKPTSWLASFYEVKNYIDLRTTLKSYQFVRGIFTLSEKWEFDKSSMYNQFVTIKPLGLDKMAAVLYIE